MAYGSYPRYVSVAEKKARFTKKIKHLRKKSPDIRPIVLAGTALSTTWWGKAWNKNLEGYADYANRIGRGRGYLRYGAVADLEISPGRVTAQVLGTRKTPYQVEITIKKIKQKTWQRISSRCQEELSSLPDLLAGKFPKSLQETFMVQGKGLFPAPEEISFSCSCPDWATMCKHVAATLYGVGARLDEDPSLFFTLRGVEMDEMVGRAVQDRADAIIDRQGGQKHPVIGDDRLGDLFGIELDDFEIAPPAGNRQGKTAQSRRKNSKKNVKKTENRKKTGPAGKTTAKKPVQPPPGYGSSLDLILGCLMEIAPDTLSARELSDITGIPVKQVSSTLQRLKQQKLINSPTRGRWLAHT